MSVAEYFGKLQPFWDEFATYNPIPSSTCGRCTCGLGELFQKRQDDDRLHDFRSGIYSDAFGALCSSLLAQDPPPTLDWAYHTLLQEETLRCASSTVSDKDIVMAMVVQSNPTLRLEPRNKLPLSCSFCHKTRHGIFSCYMKNGYPKGWGDRGRWQKLLSLLGNSDTSFASRLTGKFPKSWLIDTGASSHVTGDISMLSHISDVSGCPICLSDGQPISATKQSCVHLSPTFIIYDVLYVPQFTCNLIYVTQLFDSLNCVVQFTKDTCVIQDLTMRNLIGVGEWRDGLYHFRSIPEAWTLHVASRGDPNLWHCRLGHPSDRVVRVLPFVSSSSHLSNKTCTFLAMIDRHVNARVCVVGSDNGTEFFCLHDYFSEHEFPYLAFVDDSCVSRVPTLLSSSVSDCSDDDFATPGVDCDSSHNPRPVDTTAELLLGSPSVVTVSANSSLPKRSRSWRVPSCASLTPPRKSGTPYPISHFVNCNRFSIGHRNFLAAITAGSELKSYKEAVVDPKWREAMQREISALEDNGTWSMVPFPESKTPLGTHWVFKLKYNFDGSIERYKA
ncbi:hypothetical protein LIER_09513 [Lithospermum erythrorhizon]|uniref:Mitochondrial protein n=1 Tax=Lithospermum erythrorhizon TaxID=34254 RepID=A0AAV3PIV3_LITER